MTIDILNVLKLKGVPKKFWSMFFEAGVKNQKFKVERGTVMLENLTHVGAKLVGIKNLRLELKN